MLPYDDDSVETYMDIHEDYPERDREFRDEGMSLLTTTDFDEIQDLARDAMDYDAKYAVAALSVIAEHIDSETEFDRFETIMEVNKEYPDTKVNKLLENIFTSR